MPQSFTIEENDEKSTLLRIKPKSLPNPATIPIFVETAPNNNEFRQLIRKNLKIQVDKHPDLSQYRLYFLLGKYDHNHLMEEIVKYDDIIVGNFHDNYANLPYKTLLGSEL